MTGEAAWLDPSTPSRRKPSEALGDFAQIRP